MSEKNITLKELIQDIGFRLTHLEDITADNRKIMVKLVKQGNTIVKFLKQFEIEEVIENGIALDDVEDIPYLRDQKMLSIKKTIDEYIEKIDGLKEFEEELKKNKDKITPGQHGES